MTNPRLRQLLQSVIFRFSTQSLDAPVGIGKSIRKIAGKIQTRQRTISPPPRVNSHQGIRLISKARGGQHGVSSMDFGREQFAAAANNPGRAPSRIRAGKTSIRRERAIRSAGRHRGRHICRIHLALRFRLLLNRVTGARACCWCRSASNDTQHTLPAPPTYPLSGANQGTPL